MTRPADLPAGEAWHDRRIRRSVRVVRKTVLTMLFATFAASIVAVPAGSGTIRPLVWVALEDADQIALVNVRTGEVLRREVTPGGPHNITVASDRTVAVALWDTDRIAILRPGAADPRFVNLGGAPHDLKVRRSMIVVANQGATHVDRVWLRSGALPRIGLKAHPHDLAISPNGRRAWVSLEASDDLAVVGLDDRTVRYVSTGVRPHDLLFAPHGRLWVTDWNGSPRLRRSEARPNARAR